MRAALAWAHFATDTVGIASWSGTDGYGEPTFGSTTNYLGRVVGEQRLVRGFDGQEVVSKHTVYILSPIVIQPNDKVVLSTSLVNSTEATAISPPILAARREPDQNGTHHAVLYLG